MEVNVRIPQNIGLGEAAGVEASWRIYATLAGIPLEPQRTQRDGVRVVVPTPRGAGCAPSTSAHGDLSLAPGAGLVPEGPQRERAQPVRSRPAALVRGRAGWRAPSRCIGRRFRALLGTGRSRYSPKSVAKAVLPASARPAAKRLYYRACARAAGARSWPNTCAAPAPEPQPRVTPLRHAARPRRRRRARRRAPAGGCSPSFHLRTWARTIRSRCG